MDDADARDRDPLSRDGDSEPRGDDIDIETIRTRLEALEQAVDHPDERQEVRRTIGLIDRLPAPSLREHIRKFTRRDIAEAFVGSILISLPMLVEDGVFDIAAHFVDTPVLFGLNVVFLVAMTTGLLYYADFRDVRINRPIFGLVPRRLTAVVVISFVTAAFTMTLWGRVEGWTDPAVAIARISVVWTAAAFGGALGDILPGESEGADINDELDQFGERLGIGDDEGLF
jgi:uncharacterized membrane protein